MHFQRTLPEVRNVIRRLRANHVPLRRANLWFGPGQRTERSFNSRISDRCEECQLNSELFSEGILLIFA